MSAEGGVPPRATYRVQLSAAFDLDHAAALAEYLGALGISHLYTSPYLEAQSAHGYDVTDHRRVSEALGGEAARQRLWQALRAAGLGQLVDIVPNHMSASAAHNRLWWDVLENGPSSRYARYFDVDWTPELERLRGVVLLPILGEHYGVVVEEGGLRLERQGARLTVHYGEHALPLAPESLALILRPAAERTRSGALGFVADALAGLPAGATPEAVALRQRDKEALLGYLERLLAEDRAVAVAVDDALAAVGRDPDRLDALLGAQYYRLAHWRAGGSDINYRRFFNIETLVGLRMEDQEVFADTHALVLAWAETGQVDGLRIDHIDGLRNPLAYLQRLRQGAPEAWILVEKILGPDETLRLEWPVAGTTGYEFAAHAGGLLVDPAGEEPLTRLYREFTGIEEPYADIVRARKRRVLRDMFGDEVRRLTALLGEIAERHRRYRDLGETEQREALQEVLAHLPVYRTYVRPETGEVDPRDAAIIEGALARAQEERPDLQEGVWGLLRHTLLLEWPGVLEGEFVLRLQQLGGAVAATGVENTAFYVYNRLVALNEVGAEPDQFGVSPEAFHAHCRKVQEAWPETLLATSTHDTKRGEDVRARLYLLSEIPGAWEEAVRRWAAHNARHRRGDLPDRNAEYLLYQTLVGAWPIDAERLGEYMLKAAHEAKEYTSWRAPDEAYDRALAAFSTALLEDREFVADLEAFVAPLVGPGRVNALAQTLLKYVAPGVPDLYQGSELWNLDLVDPDNRRPVDYGLRRSLLAEIEGGLPVERILERMDEGLPKLFVIQRALAVRRRRPDLFGPEATYTPLAARGAKAAHVVALARGGGLVAVAPRLVLGLGGDWGDTTLALPPGDWRDAFTGREARGEAPLAALLGAFPVALLMQGEGGS
jgi:(1->4)-alpha-D-glucan 1-alpha-D-glucosylmutase